METSKVERVGYLGSGQKRGYFEPRAPARTVSRGRTSLDDAYLPTGVKRRVDTAFSSGRALYAQGSYLTQAEKEQFV